MPDAPPLESGIGFNWDAAWETHERDDESSDHENAAGESSKKKSKRAKARAKREEEEAISRQEAAIASGATVPESADDFDRLVLASPNSSFIWIQYMAFYLNLVELDKARQVAERALKTIQFREEKEKYNVWMAYLNLENKFGTPESLRQVLDRAAAYNDPKHVYLSLAKIYEKTEKFAEAQETYALAAKKFKQSSKVWVQFGLYWFFRGNFEEARKVLQRSMKSLPKRKRMLHDFCANSVCRYQDDCQVCAI
jgi:rRNA biogenesis protein RRP5